MTYVWKIPANTAFRKTKTWPTAFLNAYRHLQLLTNLANKSFSSYWKDTFITSTFDVEFNDLGTTPTFYVITYDSYEDYIAFILKWS